MATDQLSLFESGSALPEGLRYAPDLLTEAEEAELVARASALPFAPFAFRGYFGKRRVASFGWRYGFDGSGLMRAEPIPDFLLPLRRRAASVAGLDADALEHVLVTEYRPGAGIGWHKDRPVFGDTIGISLASACPLRFRRRHGQGWERRTLIADARSAYVLSGPARHEWEHSIAPVDRLRFSVTFRTLVAAASGG